MTLLAAALVTGLLAAPAPSKTEKIPMSLHALSAASLDGKTVDLSVYRGKVLLVVNTASECGYTPQYAGLQKLFETMEPRGVVVLGFPSNDFGGQEPGSAEQIRAFCDTRFKVRFPMFAKVKTKPGEGQSPVYGFLAAAHGAPKWNFHKYVVGKDGQVTAAFPSDVAPDSPKLLAALEAALAK